MKGKKIAWVGDGNNVLHDLALAAGQLGRAGDSEQRETPWPPSVRDWRGEEEVGDRGRYTTRFIHRLSVSCNDHGGIAGMHVRVATPEGYLPNAGVMKSVDRYCKVMDVVPRSALPLQSQKRAVSSGFVCHQTLGLICDVAGERWLADDDA